MIKKLHKISMLLMFAFATIHVSAQVYTFDTDTEGWISNGAGVWGSTNEYLAGTSPNTGILYIKAKSVDNANIQAYMPTNYTDPSGFNTDTYQYVRIVLKNNSESEVLRFRVKIDGAGGYKNITDKAITKNDTSFKTYDLDLSEDTFWSGTTSDIAMAFIGVDGANFAGETVEIDSVEFLTTNLLSTKNNTLEGANVSVANDVINIVAPVGSQSNVYAITGGLVASSNQASIDASSLASGVYFVKVANVGKVFTKKVIIE
ncbi:T9SS type A sorting domain-containing protein [Wenyingzhuangia sp. 1_MG-2023]|nr:T9SS type A sorting domain-containing protein [Wenyingzhuangia sp. 1_MG-2023]